MRTYTFKCPVCRKTYQTDAGAGEPCCTGPSEMRDDHPLTVMRLSNVERVDVHPTVGIARSRGPLILAS